MLIEISIATQKLTLLDERGEWVAEYAISTAANGVGFDEGSFCTPTGRFKIREKMGSGEALGTIFKARRPVGRWDGSPCEDDLVLTRILRLHGLDPENANTMDRYIYIHGTNQENLLGKPASCGCIRMSNIDILNLFDLVNVECGVVIG